MLIVSGRLKSNSTLNKKEASISTIFHTQCRVQTLDIYTFLEKDISRDVIYHRIFLKSIFFLVGLRKTIADFTIIPASPSSCGGTCWKVWNDFLKVLLSCSAQTTCYFKLNQLLTEMFSHHSVLQVLVRVICSVWVVAVLQLSALPTSASASSARDMTVTLPLSVCPPSWEGTHRPTQPQYNKELLYTSL